MMRSLLAALGGALALSLALAPAASASVNARTAATSATSVASWGISLSKVGTTNVVPGSPSTTSLNLLSGPMYFTAKNTGTANLSGMKSTYTVTPTGVLNLGYIEIRTCSAAWNESDGTCSGTVAMLASTREASPVLRGTDAADARTSGLPLVPDSTVRLQVIAVNVSVLAGITMSATVLNH